MEGAIAMERLLSLAKFISRMIHDMLIVQIDL